MRMPHLQKFGSKKIWLAVAGAIVVLAGAAGTWWWMASQQQATDYRTKVAEISVAVQKELDSAADSFKSLTEAPDKSKRLAALASLSDNLAKRAGELPTLPTLLGISLAPQQDQQKRQELVKQLTQLSQDAKASHDLLVYQHAVATTISQVAGLNGKNPDEQKALADAWQRLITALNSQTPPEPAKGAHQQLINAASAVQASIAGLPDLYAKKDYNGFDAKKKEVEARLGELRKVADVYTALNQTYDTYLARDHAQLANILK